MPLLSRLLAIFVLVIPSLLKCIVQPDVNNYIGFILSYILLWTIFHLLLAVFKSNYIVYLIVAIPSLIASCIESVNLSITNEFVTLDILRGIVYTTSSEVSEFFSLFTTYFLLPMLVGFSIHLMIVHFKNKRFLLIRLDHLLSVMVPSVIAIFLIFFYKILINELHPVNFYARAVDLIEFDNTAKKYAALKNDHHYNATIINEKASPDIVVLIIGERARFLNWSVNGYQRKTSPYLDTMANLISFRSHYSNANTTANSIPLIITQATPNNFFKNYAEKTIVTLMKEAGYQTYWVANQAGVFDYIDHEDEIDHVYKTFAEGKPFDTKVLPVFDKLVDGSKSKKFIVINLIGSHGIIPDDLRKFKPDNSNLDHKFSFKNKEVFINEYDNMIHSQDFILGKIIQLLKNQNKSSVLLYTSDHGANLFENGKLYPYSSKLPTHNETHIPLFVWYSDKYEKMNSEKIQLLKLNAAKTSTNDDLFATVSDLSSINYNMYTKRNSLADSTFIHQKNRYVFVNGKAISFPN